MSINEKIQARSHSGATLKVIKHSDNSFRVNKEIKDNLERNHKAILKQQRFDTLFTSCYQVSAIPINSIEKTGSLLSIDMPYIDGIGGEQFAIHGNKSSATNLKVTLNSYLMDLWAKSDCESVSPDLILRKIESISSLEYNEKIKKTVDNACDTLRTMCNKELFIPISKCHGDLTLSNMIVSVDKLFIFDFLDSMIESPLQDAAKIIQDMKYGWTFRNSKPSIKLKGKLFCEAAYPNFIDTIESLYPNEMKIFEVLTILRIAPYISNLDETTQNWFNNTINQSLNGQFK